MANAPSGHVTNVCGRVRHARYKFSNQFHANGAKLCSRAFGYTWIYLDTLGNILDTLGNILDTLGYTWSRVTTTDTVWIRMDILEYVWQYFGYVWGYLATLWQCVTTGDNAWRYFGYTWVQTWKTAPCVGRPLILKVLLSWVHCWCIWNDSAFEKWSNLH